MLKDRKKYQAASVLSQHSPLILINERKEMCNKVANTVTQKWQMKKFFLGIDQGTTGTTALLIDEHWNVVGRGYKEHKQIYPAPGWVEHDPEEVLDACRYVVDMAIRSCPSCQPSDIVSLGIDNQGETCTIWNINTGKPLNNAIVWQDRRTSDFCDRLKASHEDYIRETTGLLPDSYFSGPKLRWILHNVADAYEMAKRGEILAGTLDSYIIWKLTRGLHIMDPSTAGRSMLMNINTAQWDDTMLTLCDIPKSILPKICDCSAVYGFTEPEEFLGLRVPICAALTDAYSALLAQGCLEPGNVKTSYGTGCFMNMFVGDKPVISKHKLLSALPWQIKGKRYYALSAGAYIAGAAIQWLRDGLQIIKEAPETQWMAESVSNTNGVYFVPAFVGLAAPWWDQYARGLLIGITGSVKKEHVVRAVLESIAFQVYDNTKIMELDANFPILAMKADGGLVDNRFLMQFQADLLGIPVEVAEEKESAAFGAAFLAALAMDEFDSIYDIKKIIKVKERYLPRMGTDERESLIAQWHRAVGRSKNWIQE